MKLRSAVVEAARLAGAELVARWKTARTVEFKQAIDLVTDADTAAERRILDFIEQRFPGHEILAEERGGKRGPASARYRWIVDPLDGTTNYAHGMPHFSVSVAVEDEQGVAAGAVYDPLRDELFEAGRGQGARLNGASLHVTGEAALSRALLATGFPYDVWKTADRPMRLIDTFVRRAQGIRRAGSAALDLAYVAAGRYDGYFEGFLKPWDLAAGMLLVVEAGGRITDLTGAPVDLFVGDTLATNGALHDENGGALAGRAGVAEVIAVDIPGAGRLELEHLVCDYNGTLACGGKLLDGVAERLTSLAGKLEVHVLTADTFGRVRQELAGLPVTLHVLTAEESKGEYLAKLPCSQKRVAAVGNGANDAVMLDRQRVGFAIAVLGPEGLAVSALGRAHVLVRDIRDGLDLLLEPSRLVATLRT
ncbi:MAG: inositol monophosphatase family protein [Myxococcales bacterium]